MFRTVLGSPRSRCVLRGLAAAITPAALVRNSAAAGFTWTRPSFTTEARSGNFTKNPDGNTTHYMIVDPGSGTYGFTGTVGYP